MTERTSQYFEHLRLTEQDRDRRILQKRASTWLFIFMIPAVWGAMLIGIVWGKYTHRDPQTAIFAIGVTLLGIGCVGAVINIFRWRDADLLGFADDDDEPEGNLPAGQPQRDNTFNQTHAPAEAETEPAENQTDDNQLSRLRYKFTREQWWSLVNSLCTNPTGTWTWNRKT